MSEQSHKRSGSGFLLGLIIGALVVFLFGTRKGRKVLRIISDAGVEFVDKMGSVNPLDEYEMPDEEIQGDEFDQDGEEEPGNQMSQDGNGSSKKRFFRGIKK